MSLHRRVAILGSTGSIGLSTLDLMAGVEAAGGIKFEVEALAAGRNVERLIAQALRWRPNYVAIADETQYGALKSALAGEAIEVGAGVSGVIEAAERPSPWVMAAIVGVNGLNSTLAAARRGATVALANKESLVCFGPDLLRIAQAAGGAIVPVDSEHSALFQVYQAACAQRIDRLCLTASGGPFRNATVQDMAAASPEQALAHPVWPMGAKISIDSATLANKGLELIEAAYYFDMPEAAIDIVVHPQSIIHSMITYADGSTLAQMSPPDMRTPIACALAWPDRLPWDAPRLNLPKLQTLTFFEADEDKFPMLRLARTSLNRGRHAPAIFSGANEAAVQAFLDRRLSFLDIAGVVEGVLDHLGDIRLDDAGISIDAILHLDKIARREAERLVAKRAA